MIQCYYEKEKYKNCVIPVFVCVYIYVYINLHLDISLFLFSTYQLTYMYIYMYIENKSSLGCLVLKYSSFLLICFYILNCIQNVLI